MLIALYLAAVLIAFILSCNDEGDGLHNFKMREVLLLDCVLSSVVVACVVDGATAWELEADLFDSAGSNGRSVH